MTYFRCNSVDDYIKSSYLLIFIRNTKQLFTNIVFVSSSCRSVQWHRLRIVMPHGVQQQLVPAEGAARRHGPHAGADAQHLLRPLQATVGGPTLARTLCARLSCECGRGEEAPVLDVRREYEEHERWGEEDAEYHFGWFLPVEYCEYMELRIRWWSGWLRRLRWLRFNMDIDSRSGCRLCCKK